MLPTSIYILNERTSTHDYAIHTHTVAITPGTELAYHHPVGTLVHVTLYFRVQHARVHIQPGSVKQELWAQCTNEYGERQEAHHYTKYLSLTEDRARHHIQ